MTVRRARRCIASASILIGISCAAAPSADAAAPEGDLSAARRAETGDVDAEATCTSGRGTSPRSESRGSPGEGRCPEPRLSTPWPTVVSVIPGVLVHGSGHFALGEDDTAYRLLALEGVGLGATLVSGTTLVLTGASRYLVAPAALLGMGGVGLFAVTFFADIYGTLAPPGGFGAPQRAIPFLETEFGYRYLYDQQLEVRHMSVARMDARWSALRLSPSAWIGLDDPTRQLRLELGVTPIGPRPRRYARSGSRFEVVSAVTHRAFDTEQIEVDTVELSAGGRLDLAAWGRTLAGSFAETSGGVAVATTSYGGDIPPDTDLLLLGTLAFGVYLGEGRGEARVLYDHRHDGFIAGSIVPGVGSGVLGRFGLEGFYYVTEHWGAGIETSLGSGYLGGASLRFRER